jgi:hypothetical protein
MEIGKMEDFTIDQFAGSLALILGSIGGLLMIIWKSRCACRINCCWLFRCERLPPPNENINAESDEENNLEQQNNNNNNNDNIIPRPQAVVNNDQP